MSLESQVIKEWLKEDASCWIAIGRAFLQRNDWDTALEKITLALTWQLRDGPPTPTTLSGRLYKKGISKVDYATLALQIALAAKDAELSTPGPENK
jgi:hypothetical protein